MPSFWARIIPACAGNTGGHSCREVPHPDHPRVRGEHRGSSTGPPGRPGSSPRARGTHVPSPGPLVVIRIIPACAGNTSAAAHDHYATADHPRVRGEHYAASRLGIRRAGSSPRARGTLCGTRAALRGNRIIPACAGNTGVARCIRGAVADHPRVRGEHVPATTTAKAMVGSSPRARGTHLASLRRGYVARIIPACAGNTAQRAVFAQLGDGSSPRARGTLNLQKRPRPHSRIIPACAGNTVEFSAGTAEPADHPRVRGEHLVIVTEFPGDAGSSPRARGTPPSRSRHRRPRRIIPACAGNTPIPSGRNSARADHPRVRGEHLPSSAVTAGLFGSSPRARGTRSSLSPPIDPTRIIPACAGNTFPCRARSGSRPDHPRVRGEHPTSRSWILFEGGSSPRARGTLDDLERRASTGRIIPACAGNTRSVGGPAALRTDHPRVRGEHLWRG